MQYLSISCPCCPPLFIAVLLVEEKPGILSARRA
jgi:hypothetical protein